MEHERAKIEPMPILEQKEMKVVPEERVEPTSEERMRKEKAVKHDDAKAPTHAWCRFLLLRRFALVGEGLDQTVVRC